MRAPTLGFPNSSGSALALFGDPLDSTFLRQVDAADIGELETAAAHAVSAWAALLDREPRTDYGFVARLIASAAEKVRASLAARAALRSGAPAELDAHIARLQAVRARLPAFRREFEAVWLRHARRSELHITLDAFDAFDAFDALDARFGAALGWLRDQRRRATAGESVDADLGMYDAGQYLPLWERGRADLRRLTDLVGAPT